MEELPEWFKKLDFERRFNDVGMHRYVQLHSFNIRLLTGSSSVGYGTTAYRKLKSKMDGFCATQGIPSLEELASVLLTRGAPAGEYYMRVINELKTFEKYFEQYKKDNPKSTARLDIKVEK